MRNVLMNLAAVAMLAAPGFVFGGGDHEHADHTHETPGDRPSVAVTLWTDRMELFMEYPVMTANEHAKFIVHLTVLDGFQPVRSGSVTLNFRDAGGGVNAFVADELLREGIFAPTVGLHDRGRYDFVLTYSGPTGKEVFRIDDFVVYASADQIPAEDEDGGDEIGFLKEQQWKIPFATAQAEVREIKNGVWAIGEVMPSPRAYAEIIAPVDGILQVAPRGDLALPGSEVKRGQVLATITPPVQGNSWVASRLAFEQAQRDYDRAQRLKERDAISDRELELARNEFKARKAALEGVAAGGDAGALNLTAPMSGKVIDWKVRPGQLVRSGDKLMAVVDPSVVWLMVHVYESDFRLLQRPVGAYIKSGGPDGGWLITEENLTVLSTGGALDPTTRTIPVLLQVDNQSGRLTVNESTPVELYSSGGESAVAVPKTAVYEDDGVNVVFVQTGGESFEKRQVRVGPHHAGWVSILDGVRAGDRVVSIGGYHVKLASTSADIGHGHAH